MNRFKERIFKSLGIDKFWLEKLESYPRHKDKLLPDWFIFGEYEDWSKIKDFKFWAFEFGARSIGINDSFLENNVGLSIKSSIAKLSWQNGVFNIFDPYQISKSIAGKLNSKLKKFGGKKILNIKFKHDPSYKNNSNKFKPLKTNEAYQEINGKRARYEFPNKECCDQFKVTKNIVENESASFLVNLKIPTSRIINELELQIEKLKKDRCVQEYKAMKNPQPLTWSQSLAVWDLWKAGVSPRVIQNRVLAKWHKDFGHVLGINAYEKSLENMFESRKKTAQTIIQKEWVKLSGHLVIDP